MTNFSNKKYVRDQFSNKRAI